MNALPCDCGADENLEVGVRLPAGFPVEDIDRVFDYLAEANPFVPAFLPNGFGLYSLVGQVWSLEYEEVDTIMLLDRNIASRMAQIARGLNAKRARLRKNGCPFGHAQRPRRS